MLKSAHIADFSLRALTFLRRLSSSGPKVIVAITTTITMTITFEVASPSLCRAQLQSARKLLVLYFLLFFVDRGHDTSPANIHSLSSEGVGVGLAKGSCIDAPLE